MQKGNIGVTTENIFPVIKKFLYSDHEIFIREIVSNAVDATQKMKTLANKGDFKGETGELKARSPAPMTSWINIKTMPMPSSDTSAWASTLRSW